MKPRLSSVGDLGREAAAALLEHGILARVQEVRRGWPRPRVALNVDVRQQDAHVAEFVLAARARKYGLTLTASGMTRSWTIGFLFQDFPPPLDCGFVRVGQVDDAYAEYRAWFAATWEDIKDTYNHAVAAFADKVSARPEDYREPAERGMRALTGMHEALTRIEAKLATDPGLRRRFGGALDDYRDTYMELSSGVLQDASTTSTMHRMDGLGPSLSVGALQAIPAVMWVLGAGLTTGGVAWIVDRVAYAEVGLANAQALEKCVTAAMLGTELPGRCEEYPPAEEGWGDQVGKAASGVALALGAGALFFGAAMMSRS